ELVAICDINPGAFQNIDFADQAIQYLSLEELIAKEKDLDVICICTPNGLHSQQALLVLDADCHVVLEKPMGLHRAACEEVVHRALNLGKQVFCVMQNRYSPAAAWLKKTVAEGELGDILQVQINCFWNRDERYYFTNDGQAHPWHGHPELDGGVLYTQFAHFVDLLYWIFGDIKNISARFANFAHKEMHPFPDSGIASFELVKGGMGSLSFSTAVYDRNFMSSIAVVASRGSVRLGGQYMDKLTHCNILGIEPPDLGESPLPNDYGPYQGSAANHHFVIDNVVDVLKGRAEVATTAEEGLAVVRVIEDIYALGKLENGQ
ncbi:MAG: Gfo/Idh/MocA family oxidoreductase, partial [Bacteroidota bacterium]